MRLAYLCHPHIGGTYGVFRTLRLALAPTGVELRWLAAGAEAHRARAAPCWADDQAHGAVAGPADADERAQSLALLQAVAEEQFDGVLINVLTSRAEMNLARYLPAAMVRVMLVHNITPGTYAAARAIRDYVNATVGVSPRIRHDLVARHRFDPARTFAIPNAVDVAGASTRLPHDGALRLLYLGRVEDAAKGVFLLPRILDGLDPAIVLTVAGDGPDLPALRARCAGLGGRIVFTGEVRPERVPSLLAAHDVLVMPSRFEGFGLTLVEAMAAGCVPVATCLAGVTDTIVTTGRDGLLFPAGDVGAARRAIAGLAVDRAALQRLSHAAHEAARARFSPQQMGARYLDVIVGRAGGLSDAALRPLEPAAWRVPRGMRAGLRTLLPAPAKNFLRTLRERIAA